MDAERTNTVIAAAALGLGAVNLWFGVLRPWWSHREAHPEVRLEQVSYATRQGWQNDERVVVVNHGPAVMRGLTLRLHDADGGEHSRSYSQWPPMPVPEVHVGQTLHLTLVRALGEKSPHSAALSWRDGRVREQTRTFWLTWQRVT